MVKEGLGYTYMFHCSCDRVCERWCNTKGHGGTVLRSDHCGHVGNQGNTVLYTHNVSTCMCNCDRCIDIQKYLPFVNGPGCALDITFFIGTIVQARWR